MGFTGRAILILGAVLCVASPAAADAVAEFYAGKQVRFVIRSGVGGGYDSYARLLTRHIGRHIPGKPTLVPINMPGGGGIIAANHVALAAPKDGTILTMVSQGLPIDQALGLNTTLKADLRSFHWIGNMSAANQVLAIWHTSQTKTLADAQTARNAYWVNGRRINFYAIASAPQQFGWHEVQDRDRLS